MSRWLVGACVALGASACGGGDSGGDSGGSGGDSGGGSGGALSLRPSGWGEECPGSLSAPEDPLALFAEHAGIYQVSFPEERLLSEGECRAAHARFVAGKDYRLVVSAEDYSFSIETEEGELSRAWDGALDLVCQGQFGGGIEIEEEDALLRLTLLGGAPHQFIVGFCRGDLSRIE